MNRLTALVAHDAGGAELLSSYIRRLPLAEQQRHACALAGPALAVFARKLPQVRPVGLDEALDAADALLCGSGWQSGLEVRAIERARALGKPSTAFLDHWVNFRARFMRDGATVLPDEVWVGDPLALDLARKELPEIPARLVDNPYFLDLRDALASRPPPERDLPGLRVLFVCEPVREHALRQHGDERHWGYTEEEALAYCLEHLDVLPGPVASVVVRPHPAEPAGKYVQWLATARVPTRLSRQPDLLDDIAASDWVIGCNSMALVVALLAGRRAMSCIPPGGRPCLLPQPEILRLATLVQERRG